MTEVKNFQQTKKHVFVLSVQHMLGILCTMLCIYIKTHQAYAHICHIRKFMCVFVCVHKYENVCGFLCVFMHVYINIEIRLLT